MSSPAAFTVSIRNLLRRFRRNRRGSAAVEFALVAPVFFALLFAIIETGIVFFAGQVLETGVQDAGRRLYTHQLQDKGLSAAQAKAEFRKDLCDRVSALLSCPPDIDVDVRFYPPGSTIAITDPIDASGNYDATGFVFQLPPNGSAATVVVRGFYQWPLFVTGLGYNIANIGRGSLNKRLLAATTAFHVEPWGDGSMLKMWLRARGSSANLLADRSGIAATEFAVIVPVMLLMFFGLVEFSSGVAADRKVTLVARTLSDLTSQSTTVSDIDLSNFGQAAKAVMTPYSAAPLKSMISELYVEPTTLNARVQWTRAWTIDASGNILFGSSSHNPKDIVEIPPALKIAGTYLIYSEVSYRYTPTVGYVMGKAGVNLSDLSYTRPRQSSCVMYKTTVCTTL